MVCVCCLLDADGSGTFFFGVLLQFTNYENDDTSLIFEFLNLPRFP